MIHMLNVYIADLTGLEEFYDEKVNMLHRERAEKLRAYKMPADRIRGLGAGLLMERGLEDYLADLRANIEVPEQGNNNECGSSYTIPKDKEGRYIIHYGYGPQGKPYLKDYPDVHFSLSHSGNMAVLAISDGEVGIDVQEHRGYNEKIASRFYHEKEIKMLEDVSDTLDREILFYKIWTCKEAYIKYTGKGMGQDLRNFYWDIKEDAVFMDNEKVAGRMEVSFGCPDYQCSVVSGTNSKKIDKIMKIII